MTPTSPVIIAKNRGTAKSYGLVSIAIGMKNEENFAARLLNSLINQTYPDLEIWCTDDNSGDRTAEIVKQFEKADPRVHYLFLPGSEKNNPDKITIFSRNLARNEGIKHSTGKYQMVIDGDDELTQDAIEIMINELVNSSSDFVIGGTKRCFPDGSCDYFRTDARMFGSTDDPAFMKHVFGFENIAEFNSHASIAKKSVVTHLYVPETDLWENTLFNIRIMNNCKQISIIPDLVYNYYVLHRSVKSDYFMDINSFDRSILATDLILKSLKERYPNNPELWYEGTCLFLTTMVSDLARMRQQKLPQEQILKRANEMLAHPLVKEISSLKKATN